jgi:Yip1 domain
MSTMTDASAPAVPATPPKGLAARALGVVFTPYETYADVAARPRALGALLLVIAICCAVSIAFAATQIGKEITLDLTISSMESFGMQVTDEMYREIESRTMNQPAWQSGAAQVVFWPLLGVVIAGILLFVFNVILGYESSFKPVFAIVVHSFILFALQFPVIYPIFYLKESMSSPTSFTVFLPFLDDQSFAARFLRWVDFFWLWWIVNLSIGMAVLYKRRTQPIVVGFLAVYFVLALAFAAIGAFILG